MKKIIIVFGVLCSFSLVLLFVFSKALGSGIKAGIETFGPQVTQAPITIDTVTLSAFSGSGDIRGLLVGNPEGFNTPYAIRLDGFRLKIEPLSVISEKIVINEIIIDGPEFIFESGTGKGKSNIGSLLANIEAFAGESSEKEEKEEKDRGAIKAQVDFLRISGGSVKVSHTLMAGQSLTAALPDIELRDIGADEDGSSFSEIMLIVFQAINQEILASLGKSGSGMGAQFKNWSDSTKKSLGGIIDRLKGSDESSVEPQSQE